MSYFSYALPAEVETEVETEEEFTGWGIPMMAMILVLTVLSYLRGF